MFTLRPEISAPQERMGVGVGNSREEEGIEAGKSLVI